MPLSTERFERLIARSTDIVVATDAKGTVAYYNDGASRTLGYTPDEIMGRPVVELYPDLEEAQRVMKAMRSPTDGGEGIVETFETTFVSKKGEHLPVAISGTILYREEDGEEVEDGSIGFAKDLREILHNDQLATLGQVAIGLGHEINNPLAVILNQAEILEREISALAGERDCSVENERLDAIRREIARISEVVERLAEMVQTDTYETVEYLGPAKMVDLRSAAVRKGERDERLRGMRVLVVDDDGGIRRSLTEILEMDGCSVSSAADGEKALAALGESEFDAVISDVVMPNMDGYDLHKAIRQRWPDLPVLMMTAFHYDKDHIIKRSRLEGLKAVIFKKPVDPQQLREALAEVTGTQPSQD